MRTGLLWLFVFSCISVVSGLFGLGRMQSIALRGRLMCNGYPVRGVLLKLFDREIFVDDELDRKYSDPMGGFFLGGSKREFSSIDPRLYIYHRCNYQGSCLRKSVIYLPKHYITYGHHPRPGDLGIVDLNGRFSEETTDCVHSILSG